ncbi:MAG: hypothetical protein F6K10_34595 [Moorea sp. SIO2B7]|nr:hypothetical protein [Moorena sp. SIO2B7]
MLIQIRRFLNQFFSKSRTINNSPINKVSLIVIILIDIFILINVFTGLQDISRWYISPSQAYPCYTEWKNYRTQTNQNKDYKLVKLALPSRLLNQTNFQQTNFQQTYQRAEEGYLGKVFPICLKYGAYKDKINNSENRQIIKTIEPKQGKISNLEQTNRKIRVQYDSTLLEKIARQPREKSINLVGAEKAKQELEQNKSNISKLKKEISALKNQLVAKPESVDLIAFVKDKDKFIATEKGYKHLSFWYPSIQIAFQSLFLLPLILLALSIHNLAQRKGYGLISLISWHLLVIFFMPLIFKIFEFLQIGPLFQLILEILTALLGGLLFLISYVYILLIPLVGFCLIKFLQKFVFNSKLQAASRVQKSRCIKCAKKIRLQDTYCPHCGFYQYVECQNCHHLTYKKLPYCKECGAYQNS